MRRERRFCSTGDAVTGTLFRITESDAWVVIRRGGGSSITYRSAHRIPLLAALLQQLGDEGGPAGLVAGAHACAVVPVEIFIEQGIVVKVRVGLIFFAPAKYRPPALVVAQEDSRKTSRKLSRHLAQVHAHAGTGGKFYLEFVPEIIVKPLQRFDQEIVDREPHRAAPIGIASE